MDMNRLLGPSKWIDPPRGNYGWAVLACALTTVIATPLREVLDLTNIVVLFLLTVLLVAARLGRGPAVLASVVSVARGPTSTSTLNSSPAESRSILRFHSYVTLFSSVVPRIGCPSDQTRAPRFSTSASRSCAMHRAAAR